MGLMFLNSLSSNTTLNELRLESAWDITKNARIESLSKEIDKLKNKVLQLETQSENLKSGKKQKKEYTEEEKKKQP
mgnify:CR=1 FL=1